MHNGLSAVVPAKDVCYTSILDKIFGTKLEN